MAASSVAIQAEDHKTKKYSYLKQWPGLGFITVRIETSKVLSPLSPIFIKGPFSRLVSHKAAPIRIPVPVV